MQNKKRRQAGNRVKRIGKKTEKSLRIKEIEARINSIRERNLALRWLVILLAIWILFIVGFCIFSIVTGEKQKVPSDFIRLDVIFRITYDSLFVIIFMLIGRKPPSL